MPQLPEGQSRHKAAAIQDLPTPEQELGPGSQTVWEIWEVKAYLGGERECLAVAPGLGARKKVHGSEPQPQAANVISISGNEVSINKGIFGNLFFTNGGSTEMSMEHLGVNQTWSLTITF